MSENMVTGHVTQTTPPSTPLDTLKALVLRNIDHLDYVLDQLGGGGADIEEGILDFLDGIKQAQYKALAEHVAVARNEMLNELRYPHPDAYRYADGSPVVELFESQYGVSTFFTRYDGDRSERLRQHLEWVQQVEANVNTETAFGEIVDGIDWGQHGPDMDA